jgi:prepilin-type N-terminal cleavage/methylation domain-containing protein
MLLRKTSAQAQRRNRRGFTLMELLVVVAILLVLAGSSILAYQQIFAKSKVDVAMASAKQLSSQMENLAIMNGGNYPDPGNGFNDLIAKGLVTKIPTDPWGTPYLWSTMPLGDGSSFKVVVWSCGPNRMDEQGNGDDVTSESAP